MKKSVIFVLLAIFLAGCQAARSQPEISTSEWKYGDLRLLDPSDTDQPGQDLIAVFTRFNGQFFQIRLDFIDLGDVSTQDIYLAIDTNPGGEAQISTGQLEQFPVDVNWDYLIKMSNMGDVRMLDSHLSPIYGTQMSVLRERAQDFIVLSFRRDAIPIQLLTTRIQIIITQPNQNLIVDKSAEFLLDAPHPARARVLFAFWNTFNPATPATTLRSWAGAHTGPGRSRHGLKYLLDAVEQTKSTVFLFDLLDPDALSALDYLGVIPQLNRMIANGRIVLPNIEVNIPGNYNGIMSQKDFILLLSNIYYYNDKVLIMGGNDYAKFLYNDCLLILGENSSLPYEATSLNDCKRLFVSIALDHPSQLLILGGDFSSSALGTPATSIDIFHYAISHPWIQIVTANDINGNFVQNSASLPYNKSQPVYESTIQPVRENGVVNNTIQVIREALEQAPENILTGLSRHVFTALLTANSDDLLELKSNYLGQIGEILAAADWADNPSPISSCAQDLDYDGFPECIFANNTIFAVIEPDGGYVPFVFTYDQDGVHQVIGPTWEFIVGLSDPSTWRLSLGVRSDGAQVLGAFEDNIKGWDTYNTKINNNSIELFSKNMSIRKSLIINRNSLSVNIQNPQPSSSPSPIPLVLDPWVRYSSGWGDLYTGAQEQQEFSWSIASQISVQVKSTTQLSSYSFNSSRSAMFSPEDPNADYPLGHYLPYPMALVEIGPSQNYTVEIQVSP